MYVLQRVGPFPAGKGIRFNPPQSTTSYRFVQIGIQAPQSPIPNQWDINFEKSGYGYVASNKFSIEVGPAVPSTNEQQNNTTVNRFIINANDILEFEDFNEKTCFNVVPFQDMDAYTIIEIQFMDRPES